MFEAYFILGLAYAIVMEIDYWISAEPELDEGTIVVHIIAAVITGAIVVVLWPVLMFIRLRYGMVGK